MDKQLIQLQKDIRIKNKIIHKMAQEIERLSICDKCSIKPCFSQVPCHIFIEEYFIKLVSKGV